MPLSNEFSPTFLRKNKDFVVKYNLRNPDKTDSLSKRMTLDKIQTIPLTIWKDGTIRVKRTRLPVDRIIYAYQQGEIPEAIFESFPSNAYTIADIYLIIAYYLQNKSKIDKYLTKREKDAEKLKNEIESAPGYQERRDKLRKKLLARWEEKKK